MSDLVNALNLQNRSSSVLGALANPAQVNPLADYAGAAKTANALYGVREKQALQAAGQAFLSSIDPATGQPNQSQFLQNMQADPTTAMAALESARGGLSLDTGTYNLHMSRLGNLSNGMGQLIADYPHGVPQDAASAAVDRAVQSGVITQQEADSVRPQFGADPIKNSQLIVQGLFRNLQGQQALNAARPGTGTIDTGQGTVGFTQTPQGSVVGQPGSITPAGSRINTGLPNVSQMLSQVGQKVYGDDAKKLGVPEGTEVTLPMVQRWNQQGAGGLVTHGAPGGQTAQPAPAPGGGSSAAPPVPPPPGTTLRTGYQPRPGSQAQPPQAQQPPAPQGQPPAPSPQQPVAAPSPQQPPAQQPPAQTAQPAQASGGFTPVVTGVPGADEDIAAYKKAQADMPGQQRNLVAGSTALQALRLAQSTGPGTADVNRIKSFLIAQGVPGAGNIDPTSPVAYEIARKNLLRFAQDASTRSGTDLGLATQLQSNANTDTMLKAANEHILVQDMGQARQRVAQTLEAPQGGVGMGKHMQNFTNNTDYRGFSWDLYSPSERDAMIAAAKKTPGAYDKLMKSIAIAGRNGLLNYAQP